MSSRHSARTATTGALCLASVLLAGCGERGAAAPPATKGPGAPTAAAERAQEADPEAELRHAVERARATAAQRRSREKLRMALLMFEPPTAAGLATLAAEPSIELVAELSLTFERADGSLPRYHLHPQGLAIAPARGLLLISAVEIEVVRTDSDPGRGRGYLFAFDFEGRPTGAVEFSRSPGAPFHPGGIELDGDVCLVSVAQYLPGSSADIYAVPLDAVTGDEPLPSPLFSTDDHIGAIAATGRGTFTGANWDARTVYEFSAAGKVIARRANPSALRWQDSQPLADGGRTYSGVEDEAFGFDVFDARGGEVAQLRWPTESVSTAQGMPPTINPALLWPAPDEHGFLLLTAGDSQILYREHPPGAGEERRDVPATGPPAQRTGRLQLWHLRGTGSR